MLLLLSQRFSKILNQLLLTGKQIVMVIVYLTKMTMIMEICLK